MKDVEIFKENFVAVDQATIDEWMPLIEGTGNWAQFVSGCPKLTDQVEIEMMAQVLDNTYKMFESRSVAADGASGIFKPIVMGLTRRVASDVIGNKIFGLQPMKSSSALAFALRGVFSGTSETGKSGNFDNMVLLTLADGTNFPEDGDISGQASGVGTVIFKSTVFPNNILVKVTSGAFTAAQNVDDADTYAAAATTISAVYDNDSVYGHLLPDYGGPLSTADGEALGIDMSEMGLEVTSKTVTAQTHKLKTKWSQELAEDLQNEQGVSAEAVLGGIAKDQLIREMNRRFIALVESNAGTVATWDYDAADGRYEGEKYINFKSKVTRTRDAITTQNMVGPATFAICGSGPLNMLETMGLLPDSGQASKYSSAYRGNALGMDIYADIWGNANKMLFGRKGGSQADAGIIYCPYIPIKMDKGFGEESGQPVAFFRTRYGLLDNLFGTEGYYAKLTTSNLPA